MSLKTTDLCDDHADILQVVEPGYRDFGGKIDFHGEIATLKVFEDNSLVRELLASEGNGRVLVVDGGGSKRCALVGGNLAVLAVKNNWAGIVVYGCVRDTDELKAEQVGIKALDTHPLKSIKQDIGNPGITVHFSDVTFRPGDYLYADEDGIIVSPKPLH